MHIPDGFIDIPTSAAFAAIAAVGVAASLKGAAKSLDEKTAPLAGLTATFIFAVQMLNFPVAVGTSGHLFGSVLAAVLVGPYVATLALSVVLLLQALLFADGGLSAAGLNIFNLSLLGVWVGYGAFLLVKKVLPKNKPSITTAAAIAAFISVPAAVLGFVLQYAIGANSTFSVTAVFTGMMGAHLLIGIGEAVITAFAVTAIMASRPDLVYGYRGAKQQLEIRKA
jgi:cobalt/nickel transport system permease protein